MTKRTTRSKGSRSVSKRARAGKPVKASDNCGFRPFIAIAAKRKYTKSGDEWLYICGCKLKKDDAIHRVQLKWDCKLSLNDLVEKALRTCVKNLPGSGYPTSDIDIIAHDIKAMQECFTDFNKSKPSGIAPRMMEYNGSFIMRGNCKYEVVFKAGRRETKHFKVKLIDIKNLSSRYCQSLKQFAKAVNIKLKPRRTATVEEMLEQQVAITERYYLKLKDVVLKYLGEDTCIQVTAKLSEKLMANELAAAGVYNEIFTGDEMEAINTTAKYAYIGGRTESFVYGNTPFIFCGYRDFDLTSAYPMALAMLGIPDAENLRNYYKVSGSQLKNLLTDNLGKAYML